MVLICLLVYWNIHSICWLICWSLSIRNISVCSWISHKSLFFPGTCIMKRFDESWLGTEWILFISLHEKLTDFSILKERFLNTEWMFWKYVTFKQIGKIASKIDSNECQSVKDPYEEYFENKKVITCLCLFGHSASTTRVISWEGKNSLQHKTVNCMKYVKLLKKGI